MPILYLNVKKILYVVRIMFVLFTTRECVWTITVPAGRQIMLNVSQFSIEEHSACRYDYLEIRLVSKQTDQGGIFIYKL